MAYCLDGPLVGEDLELMWRGTHVFTLHGRTGRYVSDPELRSRGGSTALI